MGTTSVMTINRSDIITVEGLNPRKRRNKVADQELFLSIKNRMVELGEGDAIIVPLLVRPSATRKGAYDLANGERRLEGAAKAGMKSVPCVVREMSNDELYQLRLLESLQHSDLHPLDESDAYLKLQQDHKLSAEMIAARVAKPVDEVKRRLTLQKITPKVRKELEAGVLTVDHAEVLAMYPAEVQDFAVKENTTTERRTGYDGKDATLVPAAGACTECPFRSGAFTDLFDDLPADRCTKKACFDEKMHAFAKREAAAAKEKAGVAPIPISTNEYYSRKQGAVTKDKWEKAKADDKGAVPGQIVDGDGVGRVIYVKVKKETQAKQKPPSEKERKLAEKHREQERRREAFHAELDAVLLTKAPGQVAKLKHDDLVLIADCIQSEYCDMEEEITKALKITHLQTTKLKDDQLVRLILLWALYSNGQQDLGRARLAAAKRWKVNMATVKKAVAAKLKVVEKGDGAAAEEEE